MMNRYCELRLVDVARIDKIKRPNNQSSLIVDNKKLYTTKLDNVLQKENKMSNVILTNNDIYGITKTRVTTCNRIGEKATRSSNRIANKMVQVQYSPKKCSIQNTDIACKETEIIEILESSQDNKNPVQFLNIVKTKIKKRQNAQRGITEERYVPAKKKLHTNNSVISTITPHQSGNSKKEVSHNKRIVTARKRNSYKIFWESKLTGARRVSKRLTNLKIKNKLLGKLEAGNNTNYHVLIKNKKINPIKAREKCGGKGNTIKRMHTKKNEEFKEKNLILKRTRNEFQTIYSKLNYTKKLYPKLASNKKIPTSNRVKIKPTGTISGNVSDLKNLENVFLKRIASKNEQSNNTICIDDNVNENICLTVKTDVEDVNSSIVGEESLENLVIENIISKDLASKCSAGLHHNNDQKSSNIVNNFNENTEQTVLYTNIQEKCSDDGSEVIIVDLESGENLLFQQTEDVELCMLNDGFGECYQTNEEKECSPKDETNLVNPVKVVEALNKTEPTDNCILQDKTKSVESTLDVAYGNTQSIATGSDDVLIEENAAVHEHQITNTEISVEKKHND